MCKKRKKDQHYEVTKGVRWEPLPYFDHVLVCVEDLTVEALKSNAFLRVKTALERLCSMTTVIRGEDSKTNFILLTSVEYYSNNLSEDFRHFCSRLSHKIAAKNSLNQNF